MTVSSILFALMGVCTKLASAQIPHISGGELAVWRYTCGLTFLLASVRGNVKELMGSDRKGLLVRGLSGGIASTCYFLAIQMTTLTHAMLLNFTFVVWGSVIAAVTMNEPLGRRGVAAMIVALVGVVFVLKPEAGHVQMGDLVALVSGVLAGVAVAQIRKLRGGESSSAIFFYFNAIGIPVGIASMLVTRQPFVQPVGPQIGVLLGLGVFSVGAQMLMTYAYRALTTAQGSLLSLTTLLYSAVLSWFMFGERLDLSTVIGATCILSAACSLFTGNTNATGGVGR